MASNERTFANDPDSVYALPNDSPEHVRLNTQAAHASAIMRGNVVHAPLSKTQAGQLLDIGCGTGVVTDFLAQKFPDATVCGLDLSVPPGGSRPANTALFQGNVITQRPSAWQAVGPNTTAFSADEEVFEYIFSRFMMIALNDWPAYLRTCFQLLRPGGYAEFHDPDQVWYNAEGQEVSSDWGWLNKVRQLHEARGLDYRCGSRISGWMKEAGFVDIEVREYRWPFGSAAETRPEMQALGDFVALTLPANMQIMIQRTMSAVGGSAEDIAQMQADMAHDTSLEGNHWVLYVTVGRRPDDA